MHGERGHDVRISLARFGLELERIFKRSGSEKFTLSRILENSEEVRQDSEISLHAQLTCTEYESVPRPTC